jgi:sulfate adenylyltransferase
VPQHLITPYGGVLRDLVAGAERAQELHEASRGWPSVDLNAEQLCDLELLLGGAYSPLAGFMTRADHDGVMSRMQLADGTPWPAPVVLSVPAAVAAKLAPGTWLALRDAEGVMLAALDVRDVWQTDSGEPPAPGGGMWLVGGPVEGLRLPAHYDFAALRLTPAEVRRELARLGWRRVVAYQPTRGMHRAEHAMTLQAAKETGASLLIHVTAGKGSSADVDHFSLVRCCAAMVGHYPQGTARLALLPFAARLRGTRETLLRAILARNYGCTHLLLEPGAAVAEVPAEIGVGVLAPTPMAYAEAQAAWLPASSLPPGAATLALGADELTERLASGREIPAWFSFPEVVEELHRVHPPRYRQGFTVFFTGLSGAGKSTIAGVLLTKFMEMGGRPVTLLDGDIVRKNLSSELGFSKEHRDINIRRIGFVASEITKNGGIALCAPIAPYDSIRKEVRAAIERVGGFVLVHVSTPLATCELRDRKGLYAKARAGLIPQFTGISDPYEEPADAEVVLDTTEMTPEEAAQEVVLYLERRGYIAAEGAGS